MSWYRSRAAQAGGKSREAWPGNFYIVVFLTPYVLAIYKEVVVAPARRPVCFTWIIDG